MKAVLVFCEGRHDVVFAQRSLGAHGGCEWVDRPVRELPSPFGRGRAAARGLIARRFERQALEDLTLRDAAHPPHRASTPSSRTRRRGRCSSSFGSTDRIGQTPAWICSRICRIPSRTSPPARSTCRNTQPPSCSTPTARAWRLLWLDFVRVPDHGSRRLLRVPQECSGPDGHDRGSSGAWWIRRLRGSGGGFGGAADDAGEPAVFRPQSSFNGDVRMASVHGSRRGRCGPRRRVPSSLRARAAGSRLGPTA